MAYNQNVKIRPAELDQDLTALNAMKGFGDYKPANESYSMDKLDGFYQAMMSARETEDQKEGEFKAARDTRVQKEWEFHNAILGAKEQVKAQYGVSSDQIQAMGLKKKSEYNPKKKRKTQT